MLKLNNVTKIFPNCLTPALKNINLELEQGDFCVLIGSNGSGKSTLMRIISEAVQSGNIASVVQDVNKGTIPEMTLLENMRLSAMRGKRAGFSLYGRYKKEAIRQLHEIQEIGGDLEKYLNKPLSSLSGGQRQLVATLMAINSQPTILLLDEHTSALDPAMQTVLMDYTAKAIAHNKITTIMVTHKLEDALRFGDRLIILHKGQIVFDASGDKKSVIHPSELLPFFNGYEMTNGGDEC